MDTLIGFEVWSGLGEKEFAQISFRYRWPGLWSKAAIYRGSIPDLLPWPEDQGGMVDLAMPPRLLPCNEPAASQQPPSVACLVLVGADGGGGGGGWSGDARRPSRWTDPTSWVGWV